MSIEEIRHIIIGRCDDQTHHLKTEGQPEVLEEKVVLSTLHFPCPNWERIAKNAENLFQNFRSLNNSGYTVLGKQGVWEICPSSSFPRSFENA